MNATPFPVQSVLYYIEEHEYVNFPEQNKWENKHEFRYEDLYQEFIEYKQRVGALKPITLAIFRDCISKRLKPEVGRRTREGGSKIRYYTFGNNPQQVIEYLKQNGLYNENL